MQLELSAHSLLSDKEVDRITVLHSVEGFALVMLCRYSWVFFVIVVFLFPRSQRKTTFTYNANCSQTLLTVQYFGNFITVCCDLFPVVFLLH